MDRSSRRLAGALIAALVCLGAVATVVGFAGVGTAQTDGDGDVVEVTRTAARVTVSVDATGGNASRPTATISAGGTSIRRNLTSSGNGSRYAHTFRLADTALASRDLSRARIRVRRGNETLFNRTRDLRYVAPIGDVSVADGGTIRVGATVVGVPTGRTVGLRTEGGGVAGTTNATVRATGSAGALAFRATALRGWTGGNVTLRPVAVVNRTGTFRPPGAALTDVRTAEGDLIVENPLFAAREYGVRITGDTPFARLVTGGPGRIRVDGGAVVPGDAVRVVDAETDGVLVRRKPLPGGTAVRRATLNGSTTITWPGRVESASAVWVKAGDQVRRIGVTVRGDRTLRLTGGFELAEGGAYRVVLDGESETAVARIPGTARDAKIRAPSDGSDGATGLPVPELPLWVWFFLGLLGSLALIGLVAVVVLSDDDASGGGAGDRSGTDSGGGGGVGSQQMPSTGEVVFRVRDRLSGQPVGEETTFRLEPVSAGGAGGGSRTRNRNRRQGASSTGSRQTDRGRTVPVTGGEARTSLPTGRWRARVDARSVEPTEFNVGGQGGPADVTVELPPVEVTLSVRDERTGDPVPDAAIDFETDATEARARTGHDGSATVEVPRTSDRYEVTVSHEKYEDETATDRSLQRASTDVSLSPLEGRIHVQAVCDGHPVAGADVLVEPRDDVVRQLRDGSRTVRTDDGGAAEVDGLLEGEYGVELDLPAAFEAPGNTVGVRGNARVRTTLRPEFDFELTGARRERVADLRREAADLDVRESLDGAIHRYYASVLTAILDAVEALPDQGHRFADVDTPPGDLADALLDAVERLHGEIEAALSTSRNADLFIACADLPEANVEYGGVDLDDLFDVLGDGWADQQRRLATRLERVDETISTEQNDLTVVSPARDPWERTREFVQGYRPKDDADAAAVAFAVSALLDAIERVFDHDQLRRRFQQTVF